MKKILTHILWASLIIALMGCTAASKQIWLKSKSEKENVFSESVKEPIPSGKAGLQIRTSIKTKIHVPSKDIAVRGYPLLLNIDGQSVMWRVFGHRDDNVTTRYERGEGVRYTLEKNLILSSGLHTIFLGLPEDDTFVQFDVTTEGGKSYVVEFKPLYGECLTGHKNFSHGVNGLAIFLNGNPISNSKAIQTAVGK